MEKVQKEAEMGGKEKQLKKVKQGQSRTVPRVSVAEVLNDRGQGGNDERSQTEIEQNQHPRK